jgi:phage tail sheath gpL-like
MSIKPSFLRRHLQGVRLVNRLQTDDGGFLRRLAPPRPSVVDVAAAATAAAVVVVVVAAADVDTATTATVVVADVAAATTAAVVADVAAAATAAVVVSDVVVPKCGSAGFKKTRVRGSRGIGRRLAQGCQIFLCAIYQNGEKYTKLSQNIPNGHKIDHFHKMSINGHKLLHCKNVQNLPKL